MLFFGLQALFLLVAAVGLGYLCGRFLRRMFKGAGNRASTAQPEFAAAGPASAGETGTARTPLLLRRQRRPGGGGDGLSTAGRDDLQQINGVDHGIEKILNDIGIFRFDQIAQWAQLDIQTIENKLNLSDRIEREGWIEQARELTGQRA